MLGLHFDTPHGTPLRILCLGAHCDDIEIGCGGTLLRLLEERPDASVHWVVFSSTPERKKEALGGAELFLAGVREKHVTIHDFRDSCFPYVSLDIKDAFERLKREVAPDVIFTHFRQDLHQDHAFISQLTWNTFRNHLILEFEIPKYDGDFGTPNFFVPLEGRHCERKIRFILDTFVSQGGHQWFSADVGIAAAWCGIECARAMRRGVLLPQGGLYSDVGRPTGGKGRKIGADPARRPVEGCLRHRALSAATVPQPPVEVVASPSVPAGATAP